MSDYSLRHRVTVHYTGSFEDGEVFDTTEGREPLTYIEGDHEVMPGFEIAVLSMEPGEKKTVTLAPKDAFGEHDPHLLYVMPTNEIPRSDDLIPGQLIYLMNGEGYQQLARVVRVADDGDTLFDFNHPMAGRTVIFNLELVSRESLAGEKE